MFFNLFPYTSHGGLITHLLFDQTPLKNLSVAQIPAFLMTSNVRRMQPN